MKVTDSRPWEKIVEHYRLEVALAEQLSKAPREARAGLYTELYDELFRQLPHHPQVAHSLPLSLRIAQARRQAVFLASINPGDSFLEVGAGDCLVSVAMAARSRLVYATDVSAALRPQAPPANFRHVVSDGFEVLPVGTRVSLAFSNQLMEHLHPDDALEQLLNIHAALLPGGRYFCVTPSRMSGPHDVSQHFDSEARGFHLKEYTCGELVHLFRQAGFTSVHAYVGVHGRFLRVPVWWVRLAENLVGQFRQPLRRKLGQFAPFRLLLGLRLLAIKGTG